MGQILLAFIAGAAVGAIFSLIKLPIPAPSTLAGIIGIIGLFCGYLAVSRFFN